MERAATAAGDGAPTGEHSLDAYLDVLVPEPDALTIAMRALARGGDDQEVPGRATANLVSLLAQALRPRRAVETGAGIGVLTRAIAVAGDADCSVLSTTRDAIAHERAHGFLVRDPDIRGSIEQRLGAPLGSLADVEGPFDLAVLTSADGDERGAVFDRLVELVASDGLIVVVGSLAGAHDSGAPTEELRSFNRHVASNPRLRRSAVLPIDDGITLVTRA